MEAGISDMNGRARLEKHLVAALREHLETRRRVHLPEGGGLLWRAFVELDATRTMHANGPNPISHSEIVAWRQLSRTPLEPHHVRIIRALDAALLDHAHKLAKRTQGVDTLPQRSDHGLSPGLFDAVAG